MKNFRLSAILVIVLFVFTSCGLKTIKDEDRMVKETKEEAEQLFEYLKNEDVENLSSLFCQKQQNEHDLSAEWKEFYSELDDKILSYDNLSTMVTQRSVKDGQITLLVIKVTFKNITMESGKTYEEMGYSTDVRDNVFPEEEGIGVFALTLEKNDDGYKQLAVGADRT